MIFLLNSERVLAEVAELSRLHISEILRVEPKVVSVKLELAPGGRIIPEFNVEVPAAGALERQYIQQGIEAVWLGWAKRELVERLAGLGEIRVCWGPRSEWSEENGAPGETTDTDTDTDTDPSSDPGTDPSSENETAGEDGPPEGSGSV